MDKFRHGDVVQILPINEIGIVLKVRQDDVGEPIIDVIRNSDSEVHICRPYELIHIGNND